MKYSCIQIVTRQAKKHSLRVSISARNACMQVFAEHRVIIEYVFGFGIKF